MKQIRERLKQFKSLPETEYKKEFMFCLLTPQSKAQNCWQAVEEISKLPSLNKANITKILSKKARFHNVKTSRILQAQNDWPEIRSLLNNKNIPQLRNQLAKNVNGYGLKESSHFLRNIGLSKNKIAILDRHILRNLHQKNLIPSPKIKSPKHYLEIEQTFLNHAKSQKIKPDELDLIWWSKENGKIFK